MQRLKIQWIVVTAGLAVMALTWIFGFRRSRPGDVIKAPITLITSDSLDLACAGAGHGALQCEFRDPNHPIAPPPLPSNRLAPYKDTRGILFLIAGLFEQPVLVKQLKEAPPASKARDQLHRFTANCDLELVELAKNFQIRWLRSGDWGQADTAWIAKPMNCRTEDDM